MSGVLQVDAQQERIAQQAADVARLERQMQQKVEAAARQAEQMAELERAAADAAALRRNETAAATAAGAVAPSAATTPGPASRKRAGASAATSPVALQGSQGAAWHRIAAARQLPAGNLAASATEQPASDANEVRRLPMGSCKHCEHLQLALLITNTQRRLCCTAAQTGVRRAVCRKVPL